MEKIIKIRGSNKLEIIKHGKNYAVKKNLKNKHFLSKIRTFKEVKYNSIIKKSGKLNVPKIISQNKDEIIYEYIDNLELKEEHFDKIIEEYIKFQKITPPRKTIMEKLVNAFIDDPIIKTQRLLIINLLKIKFKHIIKIQKLILLSTIKQKKILKKECLMHNDFFKTNILIKNKNKIYFNDLESITTTKKWVLLDIIRFSRTGKEFEIETKIINKYLKKIDKKILNKINILEQVKIGLLIEILQEVKTKKEYTKYLKDILNNKIPNQVTSELDFFKNKKFS